MPPADWSMSFDGRWTWNGEKIRTERFDRRFDRKDSTAVLDDYDPTPWDADTPAKGPHSRVGFGDSEPQAICDLIEQIWEAGE